MMKRLLLIVVFVLLLVAPASAGSYTFQNADDFSNFGCTLAGSCTAKTFTTNVYFTSTGGSLININP